MKQQQTIEDETEKGKKIETEQQVISSLNIQPNSHDEFSSILIKEFTDMKGPIQQRQKRLINRLQKFFLRGETRVNVKQGYFCKRRQPACNFYKTIKEREIKLVGKQIILFGIDFAKYRDIVKAYLPEKTKNIDLSHIKLVYNSFEEAMAALRRNMREEVVENGPKLEENQLQPPQGWMQMRPYYIDNYERRMVARFATEEQLQLHPTSKIESQIPQFAKKVYELKKKHSEDIEENYKIREEEMRQRKYESRDRRGWRDGNNENDQRHNGERMNSRRQQQQGYCKDDDRHSQKSYSFQIGGKRGQNEEEKRQRSRDKDGDDNRSVTSKKSSASSLANRLNNNLNLNDDDKQSVVSDLSFILDQDQNKELFEDMAMRLGLITVNQTPGGEGEQISLELNPQLENSFESQASSNRSYRLTDNMPDQLNETDNDNNYSFSKKQWYSNYMEEQEKEEERRREKEKEEKTIIILDD